MRIALALPPAIEGELARQAERHGHVVAERCVSALELEARIAVPAAGRAYVVDVAIVAASAPFLTGRLLAACDDAGIRLVAVTVGETECRFAASLGLNETADAASPWSDIELLLTARPAFGTHEGIDSDGHDPDNHDPDDGARGDRAGSIVAVWGPAGAPGRTTLAITIAAELAAAGRSVVLADVDTYSGSVAPALGLLDEAPGFAAACRLAGADSLTVGELDRIAQQYGTGTGGFRVLTGIGRPTRWPELSAARVEATLELCRRWVDFTVVDTGFSLETDEELVSDLAAPRRNGAGIAALRAADTVIAVGAADPVGLSRYLRAHVDLVETVAAGRVIVVMNKVRASAIGLNPTAQVTQTLARFGGIVAAGMVPFDSAGLDAAILSGQSLADAAPRSPARLAIRDLVESRLLPPDPGRRRGRRQRARSA